MNLYSIAINSFVVTMVACFPEVSGSSRSHCVGTCYSGRLFPEPQDIFHGKHLRGYSYNNITTDDPVKCYSSCVQDCRCKACQMKDARCELLDEDKTSKSLKDEPGYVHFDLKQTMYQGESHMVRPGVCYNGCCRSQPCMNGGTCVEHCKSPKKKFTCKCQYIYTGKICETRLKESCLQIMMTSQVVPADGIYRIKRENHTIPVFCDFSSPNRAWTLIESFSLEKKSSFMFKPFYIDYKVSNWKPNWESYRLSLSRMQYFRSKSTLFRATCDFPNRDSLTPDLLIGRLSEWDIFKDERVLECKRFEFIDIQGHNCTNCSALSYYGYIPQYNREPFHIHLDVTGKACDFNVPSQKKSVDRFGFYKIIDELSKCTSTPNSTTQWWLGEEK